MKEITKVIVVLGSWGSGTSAVIGALERLGCHICPPHFKTNDSRTPNSFESLSLRSVIIPNFNEYDLHFSGPDRGLISGILKDWATAEQNTAGARARLAVKLPHLCFFIPDMVAAWDPVFIMIERPADEIEASRLRRGWPPHLGAQGAVAAYAAAERDLKTLKQEYLKISYADLTKNPAHTINQINRWASLCPGPEARAAAIEWVAR